MALLTEEELAALVSRLEQQELDCQTGSGTVSPVKPRVHATCHVSQVPVPVYCELLAAYLASDPPNLTQAKFLVQRVPQSVRDSEEAAAQELARLWRIGRSLWTRNIAEVYKSLEGPWSQPVQRIVDKVTFSDIHTDREQS